MSTRGVRDFRPHKHFSPKRGWINDPNGLVFDGRQWHLFAQYYPDDGHWGPMHWLHAVSDDLLAWREVGIALAPDEALGLIFSGSAVIDENSTSGLGPRPMVCMFTHHGRHEQQSVAFSNDYVHFEKYAGNPVIPNAALPDFRDPKVFRDEARGRWACAVAAGDHVEFFASEDLLHWTKTGEFGRRENRMGGVFECPDLFRAAAPGSEMWVLSASMALPRDNGGSRTQYFLGEFDGETFRETLPSPRPRLLDFGYDNYAAVTFSGAREPLLLGWATSWCYADRMPEGDFCGQMTYARRVRLVETLDGLRLAAEPVAPEYAGEAVQIGDGETCPLPGELFRIDVEARGAFRAELSNDDGERFVFGLDAAQQLYTDRTRSARSSFSNSFDSGVMSVTKTLRMLDGSLDLQLHFDRCVAELYADGGTYANTTLVFPDRPYTRVSITGAASLRVTGE